MTTVAPKSAPGQPEPDYRPGVVKAGLLAAGSFITAVGTLLAVAGQWRTTDGTVRYAITMAGVITALALGIAAIYVSQRR